MTPLAPCPFCGGEAERVGAAIRCWPCGVSISPRWERIRVKDWEERLRLGAADAAGRWNRRAAPCAS